MIDQFLKCYWYEKEKVLERYTRWKDKVVCVRLEETATTVWMMKRHSYEDILQRNGDHKFLVNVFAQVTKTPLGEQSCGGQLGRNMKL